MDIFLAGEDLVDHNFSIPRDIPSSDNTYWSIDGTIHSNNKGVASLPMYLRSHQPANKRAHLLDASDGVKRVLTSGREQGQCVEKIGSAFLPDPQVRLDVSQVRGHVVTPTSVEAHEQENQHDGTCDASNGEEETTFVNEEVLAGEKQHHRPLMKAGKNRGFPPILATYSGHAHSAPSS
jgi:hypothetical protein